MIYLELSLYRVIDMDLFLFFTCSHPVWLALFVGNTVSSPVCIWLVKKQISVGRSVVTSRSSVLFHWSMCLFFMPMPCSFYYCSSVIPKIWNVDIKAVIWLFKIVLSVLSFLIFHMKFKIFNSYEEIVLDFDGYWIESVDCF